MYNVGDRVEVRTKYHMVRAGQPITLSIAATAIVVKVRGSRPGEDHPWRSYDVQFDPPILGFYEVIAVHGENLTLAR